MSVSTNEFFEIQTISQLIFLLWVELKFRLWACFRYPTICWCSEHRNTCPASHASLIHFKWWACSGNFNVVLVFVLAVTLQNCISNHGSQESEFEGQWGGEEAADDVHWIKVIIEKHVQGVYVVDLRKQYECSTSMICTSLKQESVKAMMAAKGVKNNF